MESQESERQYGVLTKVAREMVSLRLTAEDKALLKQMALEQTKRAGGLRVVTVTDVVRWAIRVGAKELGVSLEDLVVEPVKNGAPKAKESVQRAESERPVAPVEEPDVVAAIVEAAAKSEPTTSAGPVESDQPVSPGSKEPGEKAALPDELEDMLKGV